MQASPMSTDIRIKLFTALATLVPLTACLMIGFYAINQMNAATDQAFEAVIQAAVNAETGGNSQAVENTIRKSQNHLSAISARNRIILLMSGTVSVIVVVLMSFLLVRSLKSSVYGEIGGRDQAITPEDVARVLENIAAEVRAGHIDTLL